jgi:alkyl hydroperoxide reductase subunit AhpC
VPAFHQDLEKFAGLDAQVLGISNDPLPCHVAWQKLDIGMVDFPLCSDFYPHGGVAEKYGILRVGPPIPGINERAVFIVDKQGKIAFSKVYPLDQTPDNDELLNVLRSLQEVQAASR